MLVLPERKVGNYLLVLYVYDYSCYQVKGLFYCKLQNCTQQKLGQVVQVLYENQYNIIDYHFGGINHVLLFMSMEIIVVKWSLQLEYIILLGLSCNIGILSCAYYFL